MRNKKILISLILFLLVIFGLPVYASTKTYERTEDNLRVNSSITVTSRNKSLILKTPSVDASEKIYDFANLLTDTEEQELYTQIVSYIDTYKMDMVVVTIDRNNKSNAMNYADDFYDYNDFGVGATFDGILLLLDMDTREIWISTTGKAQLVYDDARINKILDYIYIGMKAKDYNKAARAFVTHSASYAAKGIPSSNSGYTINASGDYVRDKNTTEPFPIIPILIICGVGSAIFVMIAASRHKTVAKATQAREYLVKDSFKLNLKTDNFVSTYTSKTYSPQSSSSGGGGSSTHHSSSGRSHGGGGRHF